MRFVSRCLFCLLLACCFVCEGRAQLRDSLLVDSLKQVLKALPADTSRADMLSFIGFQCQNFDPAEGMKYSQMALSLSRELKWEIGIADAYNSMGANCIMVGDAVGSLRYNDSALQINIRLNRQKDAADNLANMGLAYSDLSNGPKAVEYLFKALKIFEKIKNRRGIALQVANLGAVYGDMLDYRRAIYYDSAAVVLAGELNDSNQIATSLMNLANAYVNLEKNKFPLKYYQSALGIHERSNNKYGVSNALSNIGVMYSSLRDFDSAIYYQLQSLEISKKLQDLHSIGYAELNLSEYYLALYDTFSRSGRSAQNYLLEGYTHARRAIEVNSEIGNQENTADGYKFLSEAQMKLGRHREALASYKLYVSIRDSVHSLENQKKIANLESVRQVELKEGKIQLLQRDINLKDLRATRDRLVRNLALVGIALALVLAISITLYFVRRRRTEKMIADEKINTLMKEQELASTTNMLEAQEAERKRISADLHDRLGSMLSTVKLYFNSVEEQIEALQRQSRDQYSQATRLLDEACDEVRKISHNLAASDLARFGLVPSLNLMRDTINKTGRLTVEVHAWGMDERLENRLEIGLYRVVQELINNILKHARASNVTIEVNKVDNSLNMMVSDNGVGFDVSVAMEKGGIGLLNMQTRVKQLGGTITFDSSPGKGATSIVEIELPAGLSAYISSTN